MPLAHARRIAFVCSHLQAELYGNAAVSNDGASGAAAAGGGDVTVNPSTTVKMVRDPRGEAADPPIYPNVSTGGFAFRIA